VIADALTVIRAVVREELRAFRTAELGVVTASYPHESSSDGNNYECDVRLRDSELELKRVPVATDRIGAVAIPNVDDLVLVQFLNGDVHSAVIPSGGRLYNDVDRPPEAKRHEYVYVSPDPEESGIRRFHLELPKGNKVTLDDSRLVLEMGGTRISVDHDGDVVIESPGNVEISADGDVTIDAGGKLELTAKGDVSIEGANVTAKGQSGATLQGAASATVKGASVTVAGQISFSPG
jgi:uncharacterized protein involved in type VI secretion and phage assembly